MQLTFLPELCSPENKVRTQIATSINVHARCRGWLRRIRGREKNAVGGVIREATVKAVDANLRRNREGRHRHFWTLGLSVATYLILGLGTRAKLCG